MKRLKRILLVGPRLSLTSGVSHHIKTLLASPLAQNFQLKYFRVGSQPGASQWRVLLTFFMTPWRFLWRLGSYWPDVVHFNPSFDPKSVLRELSMLVICKVLGRRTVVQFHGGNVNLLLQNGRLPGYLRVLLRWTDQIVVLTQLQKQSLLAFCKDDKIAVIPNMVDTSRYFNTRRLNSVSPYQVLYMSKIEQRKGIFDLIQAIPAVTSKFPNIQFLVAGEGPDKSKLQCLGCEDGNWDYIKLLGYIGEAQKPTFLAKGDLFVFPSHYVEGMPYALLEAMAAGLPIVASATGGIPAMVKDRVNGILIPVNQPAVLAEAIIELLSNKKMRQQFGRRNRQLAEAQYEMSVVCQKFGHLYERLGNRCHDAAKN